MSRIRSLNVRILDKSQSEIQVIPGILLNNRRHPVDDAKIHIHNKVYTFTVEPSNALYEKDGSWFLDVGTDISPGSHELSVETILHISSEKVEKYHGKYQS